MQVEPNERRFVVAFALVIMIIRVMWVLFQDFCQNLLMGYDLDASLHVTKISWSVLEIGIVARFVSMVWGQGGSRKIHSGRVDDETVNKKLAKFSKLKNEDELVKEIARVKAELQDRKAELTCLENMMFTFDQSSNNSSQSENKPNSELKSSAIEALGQGPSSPIKQNIATDSGSQFSSLESAGVRVQRQNISSGSRPPIKYVPEDQVTPV
jgi:hypothetical protein